MSLVLIPDGPGTTIILQDGLQGLPVAPRGTGAFMGQFSSGPIGAAALSLTPSLSRIVVGDPDDDFEASLILDDFYSEFSAPALLGRVTDGNERTSFADLWDRKPDRSYSRPNGALVPDRAPLAQAQANNGGRWAGAKFVLTGLVAAIATDLTSNTLDLATSPSYPAAGLFVDQVKGATLVLEGDTGFEYEIDSNDAAGVVTIKGEFSQAAQDATGAGAITGDWYLIVPHTKELAVAIGQDSRTAAAFSLAGFRKFSGDGDWEQTAFYQDLELNSDDDRPWVDVITEGELTTYQIAISTSYTGATVEEQLPANYCEVPDVDGVSLATLTAKWFRWAPGATNTGTPFVGGATPVDATKIEPHVYTLTFTTATDFNVVVTWPDGTSQTLLAGTTAAQYVPVSPLLSQFRIRAGSIAAIAGDTITLRVNTLPHDLSKRTAYLYPVALQADGDTNQRLRIASNDYRSVTVRSDLVLTDFGAGAPTSPAVTGSADLTAVSLGPGDTVILDPDGLGAVTLTSAGSGPGAAAIAVELTSLDLNNQFLFDADPADTTRLRIRMNQSFGSKALITFGAGTGHAALGIPTTGSVVGTDGTPFRIEARWPMWGGYDGVAPDDADYVVALDKTDHIFKRWMSMNIGGVRLMTPGVTSATVKGAAEELVRENGWMYYAEFASSLESQALPGEAAIANMLANEIESNYVLHYFPSRIKYLNVAGTKSVPRSNSGHLAGRTARLANIGIDGEKGLQIAVANSNPQGQLAPRAKGLSDDIGRWTPPIGLLNNHGIVPILWEGPSVFPFGNRMFSLGRTPSGRRYTITERAVNYHIARDLFTTTRPTIFKTISSRRLGEIQSQLRQKMLPYFQDGWFSDDGGLRTGFDQQVSVEVPLADNPPESLQEGLVNATIQFRPRPSLEDLVITISPTQLTSEG